MFNNVVRMVSQKFELGDKSSALVQIVVAYITNEQSGGLASFMEFVKAKGLGGVAKHWVSDGVNEVKPLEAFDVLRVFGDRGGLLDAISKRLDLDRVVTASAIGLAMPKIVSMLTPNGELPTTIGKDIMDFASKGLTNVKELFGHSISVVGGVVTQGASKIGDVSKVASSGISQGASKIGTMAKNSTKSSLSSLQSVTAKLPAKYQKSKPKSKEEIVEDILTPKNAIQKKESKYSRYLKIIPFAFVAGLLGWFLNILFFGEENSSKSSDIMLSDINHSVDTKAIQESNKTIVTGTSPATVINNNISTVTEVNESNLSIDTNATMSSSVSNIPNSVLPVASAVVAGGVVGASTNALAPKPKVVVEAKPKVKVWVKPKPKVVFKPKPKVWVKPKPKVVIPPKVKVAEDNIIIKDNRVNNASMEDKDIKKFESQKSDIIKSEPIAPKKEREVVKKTVHKEKTHPKPKVKKESNSENNNHDEPTSNGNDESQIFFNE
ncbi:MAG: hypothetical protein IE878_01065 [Epsilonproteobacteria bacterium]|nr:hypothetical protein [Campylobacterota bacterium]MBD3838963.1 hypothetical protein [Campylobacterota bacterium]